MSRRRLGRHELAGVLVSMLGLLALAISLSHGTGEGSGGSTAEILLWLGATAAAAGLALRARRRVGGPAIPDGAAGRLPFSLSRISVEGATDSAAPQRLSG